MDAPEEVLTPGRVYRTREFKKFSSNPTRWAARLVKRGCLSRLGHGLYCRQRMGRFGNETPDQMALIRAFIGDDRFIVTGPPIWNALGLGSTGLFPMKLVYNHRRSGRFLLDGRPIWLRRVRFPEPPILEWYIVDLFENTASVGADPNELAMMLARKLRKGEFDAELLKSMADEYGSAETQGYVKRALGSAASSE